MSGRDRCDHPEDARTVEVGGPENEPMAVRCDNCGVHL